MNALSLSGDTLSSPLSVLWTLLKKFLLHIDGPIQRSYDGDGKKSADEVDIVDQNSEETEKKPEDGDGTYYVDEDNTTTKESPQKPKKFAEVKVYYFCEKTAQALKKENKRLYRNEKKPKTLIEGRPYTHFYDAGDEIIEYFHNLEPVFKGIGRVTNEGVW